MRLDGKTAIVTGGAQGFGAGIVAKFVSEGARVMVADINGDAAEKMASQMDGYAFAHQVDVSNGNSVDSMAEKAMKNSGTSISS